MQETIYTENVHHQIPVMTQYAFVLATRLYLVEKFARLSFHTHKTIT